jgi:hypothetical protein
VREALHKIQAFLTIVLAERAGPLTSRQRDLLESAKTTTVLAELLLLTAATSEQVADVPSEAEDADSNGDE